ncbi:MAG: universal stress protein [Pseudomonadota bacterium]|uniref:universal stress protein n=1 Tax=Phenylobacterium sp. TaxID=1871053 RepID=UPI00272488CA|nr:universal stress protein [Phenylobacterium sp.]MDO9430007.1 universal stress protein [Phenylobacterium sp.]
MTYKTLLCHAQPNADYAEHLRCAANLSDELEAMVIGLGAAAIPPFAVSAGGSYAGLDGEWLALMSDQIRLNLEGSRKVFEEAIGARAREWRTQWLEPTPALAQAARGADLIIVRHGGPGHPNTYSDVDVGQLVVSAGRPVLMCPPGRDYLGKGPILVAWKDSRESRRAIADALPLMQRSGDVLIVEASPDADISPAAARVEDVAEALARHGVRARSEVLEQSGRASQAIMTRAGQLGAELIVAGGYGHTRLGEWAFGGVTRNLLEQERYFVLFSH